MFKTVTALALFASAFSLQAHAQVGDEPSENVRIHVESVGVKCHPSFEVVEDALFTQRDSFPFIKAVAPSSWWSRGSMEGRIIVNCQEPNPQVVISYIRRYGAKAQAEALQAGQLIAQIEAKHGVELECRDINETAACLAGLPRLMATLDAVKSAKLNLVVKKLELVGSTGWPHKGTPYYMVQFTSDHAVSEWINLTTPKAAVVSMKAEKLVK